MTLSVAVITCNEEANIGRTLNSVVPLLREVGGEIVVVDSGSTDRTREIAESLGATVFLEDWKGYSGQKNSAIAKANGDWVLLLDADEELTPELRAEMRHVLAQLGGTAEPIKSGLARDELIYRWRLDKKPVGFYVARRNMFLGRWMRYGGFWPDRKLRLFRRGMGEVEGRPVHEDVKVDGPVATLHGALLHHAYPCLSDYIDHMNRYSSLGAQMAGPRAFNLLNIVVRPILTFLYNYVFRLGLFDGKQGLLLHLYHAVYVSWKYAKAWESAPP